MITSADVLIVAPELGTTQAQAKVPTSPSGDQIVADVIAQLSSVSWLQFNPGSATDTTRFDQACKYLAAHRWALTVRGAFGASGPVTQEGVGSVTRQYAAPSPMGTDPDLDLTPYGKQFKALRKSFLVARIGIVA